MRAAKREREETHAQIYRATGATSEGVGCNGQGMEVTSDGGVRGTKSG
jgi:hypothetical protein